jgi:hypothetical protein
MLTAPVDTLELPFAPDTSPAEFRRDVLDRMVRIRRLIS